MNEDRYDFDSSSSCESDNEKVRKFEIAKKLFFEILVIRFNEVVSFYQINNFSISEFCSILSTTHKAKMNSRLMKEFEEFEGLSGLAVDELVVDDKEDDDPSFRPAQASLLTSNDIYYEVHF